MRLVEPRNSAGRRGHDAIEAMTGSLVALVTPFRDGQVDTEAMAALCERQVRAGTSGLVVCGSTGEAPALTDVECRMVVQTAVASAAGRVPVIAGCGAPCTDAALARAMDAVIAGADAVLCAPPPYVKPSQAGISAHVQAMAVVGVPVILYDVPSHTGVAIADETVARLHQTGFIAAIKDATADLSRPARLAALAGPRLRQFTGDDATAAAYLAMGGHGCISVAANLVPGLCRAMHQAWAAGDLVAFVRWRTLLAPLHEAMFLETNPVAVKAALAEAGLCGGDVRLPLVEASPATEAVLRDLVPRVLAAEAAGAHPALALVR